MYNIQIVCLSKIDYDLTVIIKKQPNNMPRVKHGHNVIKIDNLLYYNVFMRHFVLSVYWL